MANFDRSGMTQAGINLMGKAIGGATIQFTKLVLGDGTMTGEILDLQGVVSPKQNVDVTRIERNDNQCTVGGELLTKSVKQGFFWRECGLYAMDPDLGEILYNYAYSAKPDYIAASDSGMMEEILVSMVALVGANANVDITIDDSMVFATKKIVDKKPYYYDSVEKMKADTSLKVGDMAITLGYYNVNDGGGAEYIIDDTLTEYVGYSDHSITNKLFAKMCLRNKIVNYKQFGAKGDGIANDFMQVYYTHKYANENRCVVDTEGRYRLENNKIYKIKVTTSCNWRDTEFILVPNGEKDFTIDITSNMPLKTLKSAELETLKSLINSKEKDFSPLSFYKNHYLFVRENTIEITRASFNSNIYKTDFFVIDDKCTKIGTSHNTYTNIEYAYAYEISKDYTVIDGGTFYCEDSYPSATGYRAIGLHTKDCSKVIIKNIKVDLSGITTVNELSGFFYTSRCYDFKLENADIFVKTGVGEENGSYGIGADACLKYTLENVKSMMDDDSWGVMGTNYMEDVFVNRCTINRIDVHYRCQNLTILNSNIGRKGVRVTGGGKLVVRDTIFNGYSAIGLRSDYGGFWKGDITIDNCTVNLPGGMDSSLSSGFLIEASLDPKHNYNYKEKFSLFGDKITIKDVIINDLSDNIIPYTIFGSGAINTPSSTVSSFKMPEHIHIDRLIRAGRRINLFYISSCFSRHATMDKQGDGAKNFTFTPNAEFHISNVDFGKTKNQESIFYNFDNKSNYDGYSSHSYYPKMVFNNCVGVSIEPQFMDVMYVVNNSVITGIDFYNGAFEKSYLEANNSKIQARVEVQNGVGPGNSSIAFVLLNNVEFLPPIDADNNDEILWDKSVDAYGLNGWKFNFLQTTNLKLINIHFDKTMIDKLAESNKFKPCLLNVLKFKDWNDSVEEANYFGPTSKRPANAKNGTKFYDTELNKELIYHNGWKDVMGNQV